MKETTRNLSEEQVSEPTFEPGSSNNIIIFKSIIQSFSQKLKETVLVTKAWKGEGESIVIIFKEYYLKLVNDDLEKNWK
jgi:hypothetical protein